MQKRKRNENENPSKRQRTGDGNDSVRSRRGAGKENLPWSEADMLKLVAQIEENIPNDDSLSYTSRLEKLDWSSVTIQQHSLEECQEVWTSLLKQVRKFRLLGEIIADMRNILQCPKTPQKQNIYQHPEKPKQPPNSFMLYTSEQRQKVVNNYPNLSPNDVARKLGQMFKSLATQDKLKYEQQYKVARMQYSEKLQDFYEKYPEMIPKKTSKRSKSVQLPEGRGPPDKPKTPFELFVKVELENFGTDISKFVVMQRSRERWNDMIDTDKMFWITWAQEQHDKYIDDLKEYLKLHPSFEPDKLKPVLTKKEKEIKDRVSGKPEKPPHGPYHLFSKLMLESEEVQKVGSKNSMIYISEKWRECTDKEKEEYKIRVEQMWDDYDARLEEYLKTLPPEEWDQIRKEHTRKKRTNTKIVHTTKNKPSAPQPKPDPPAMSTYKYFLSKYQDKENPMEVWKSMTDEGKDKYKKMWEDAKADYIRRYEQYLKGLSKEELKKLESSSGDGYDTSSDADESETEDDDQ